jgi:hypothetical protein
MIKTKETLMNYLAALPTDDLVSDLAQARADVAYYTTTFRDINAARRAEYLARDIQAELERREKNG